MIKKAIIISVGDELLRGETVDTNSAFIAAELLKLNIPTTGKFTVGDDAAAIKDALFSASMKADLVILTGGLGPTPDDITKETVADYYDLALTRDEYTLKKIQLYFTRSHLPVPAGNEKQADVPKGAAIFENTVGTAPGFGLDTSGNCYVIMLPGPPSEVSAMFEKSVVPYLRGKAEGSIVIKTICCGGIGESALAELISTEISGCDKNTKVATYVKDDGVNIVITSYGAGSQEATNKMLRIRDAIFLKASYYIYGEDRTTLEEAVAKTLIEKKLKVAVAESCTGGLFTAKLVNYPGISESLIESFITYSNWSKVKRIGVDGKTIFLHGSVSEETSREMAEGIARESGADVTVSITGTAGPGGGTSQKPVGLIYIAVTAKGKTLVRKFNISGGRQKIRQRAVSKGMFFLYEQLREL